MYALKTDSQCQFSNVNCQLTITSLLWKLIILPFVGGLEVVVCLLPFKYLCNLRNIVLDISCTERDEYVEVTCLCNIEDVLLVDKMTLASCT